MEFWEISSSLHSDEHFDDHLAFEFFSDLHDEGVAVIADGVTETDGGRLAAIVACKTIPQFIRQNRSKFITRPFELIEAALEDAGKHIMEMGIEIRENGEEAVMKYADQIDPIEHRDGFLRLKKGMIKKKIEEGKTPELSCTAIVIYFKNQDIFLGMVGDGSVFQVGEGRMYPYLQSMGQLVTYLNSLEGLRRPLRKLHIQLPTDEIFMIGSDGAELSYRGEAGAPYGLLRNTLKRTLKEDEFSNFSERWHEALKLQEQKRGIKIITDDFSLIVLRRLVTEGPEDYVYEEKDLGGKSLEELFGILKSRIDGMEEELGQAIAEKITSDFLARIRSEYAEQKKQFEREMPQEILDAISEKAAIVAKESIIELKNTIEKETKEFTQDITSEIFESVVSESSGMLDGLKSQLSSSFESIKYEIQEHAQTSISETLAAQAPSFGESIEESMRAKLENLFSKCADSLKVEIPTLIEAQIDSEEIQQALKNELQNILELLTEQINILLRKSITNIIGESKPKIDKTIRVVKEGIETSVKESFAGFIPKLAEDVEKEVAQAVKKASKEISDSVITQAKKAAAKAAADQLRKSAQKIEEDTKSSANKI